MFVIIGLNLSNFLTRYHFDFKIICLTEAWLNDFSSSLSFFPEMCTVNRAHTVCDSKLCSGGVLIALSEAVFGAKHRSDLECFDECVWVEVGMTDEHNLFIFNHYLHLMLRLTLLRHALTFRWYIRFLNYRVTLLGDFNVPGFDSNYGLSFPNFHYYTELKGNVIQSATSFLGSNQYNYPDSLLDLFFLQILLISLLITLNTEQFNLIVFILFLSLILTCQFDVLKKI
jgi:hypothetical protein